MTVMLAPLLQGFFMNRLSRQRGASPATIAAHRDTFRLLLTHRHRPTGTDPPAPRRRCCGWRCCGRRTWMPTR
jgi:hypothetical protein